MQQSTLMAVKGWTEDELADHSYRRHDQLQFPGSQPVSLDRKNLELLRERRYWVRPPLLGSLSTCCVGMLVAGGVAASPCRLLRC